MKQFGVLLLAGCMTLCTASCASHRAPGQPAPVSAGGALPTPVSSVTATTQSGRDLFRQTGIASWYGRDFQGRPTASGEIFDMNGLSAAHRTLPLGTAIRVTNLANSRSVTVTVNDRGPFVRDRIVELSYGAAQALGFIAQGTAQVEIESLEPVDEHGSFTVQAAVFLEEENAKMLRARLTRRFESVSIVRFTTNEGVFFRVRVGSYSSEAKAERIASKLVLEGLEPIVVKKD